MYFMMYSIWTVSLFLIFFLHFFSLSNFFSCCLICMCWGKKEILCFVFLLCRGSSKCFGSYRIGRTCWHSVCSILCFYYSFYPKLLVIFRKFIFLREYHLISCLLNFPKLFLNNFIKHLNSYNKFLLSQNWHQVFGVIFSEANSMFKRMVQSKFQIQENLLAPSNSLMKRLVLLYSL